MSPHAMPPLPPTPLFAGLADAELQAVAEQMRPREFAAGEQICAAGEASDRLWLITGGLVHILAGHADAAAGEVVARQRKGDVVGAQGAVTGEPRTATVVAALPASAMELDAERFLALAQRYPAILVNLIRIQSERLVIANARRVEHERGETVALLSSPALAATATRVAELAKRVSPRPVIWLDRRLSFAGTLTAADDLTDEHATVLLPGELDPETMGLLLDEVDRVVALVGSARDAERLGALARGSNGSGAQVETVLIGDEAVAASREWPAGAPIRVVRTCQRAATPGGLGSATPATTPGPPRTEPGRSPRPAGCPPPTRRGWRATSPARSWAWRWAPAARRGMPTWARCRCWRRPATWWIMCRAAASARSSAPTWRWEWTPRRSTPPCAAPSTPTTWRSCSKPRWAAAAAPRAWRR